MNVCGMEPERKVMVAEKVLNFGGSLLGTDPVIGMP